jgi:hypothetical protein
MENVKFVEVETTGGTQEHAIIENADGSIVSMPKSEYDRRQAEQSTPNLLGE